MKHSKILALASFLVLLNVITPGKAHSQVATSGSGRQAAQNRVEEMRELRQLKRLELQEKLEQKRATRQAQLAERRKERIRAYFRQMVVRIDATIQRLEMLIQRLESRLGQIETANEDLDTESIAQELANAQVILEELRVQLLSTNDELEMVLSSNDPKSGFQVLRESIGEIKDGLVEVHVMLVKIVGDIKGLRVGQNNI